jgi:hypothetical protein
MRGCRVLAASVVTGLLTAVVMSSPANAATQTFTTSESEFDAGFNNQGWWVAPPSPFSNFDGNDNYVVGTLCDFVDTRCEDANTRNFFTFDLSGLDGAVVSARLELTRFLSLGPDPSETIGFFDVSTDPVTLNNNTGTSTAIHADLGSGVSYGAFAVTTSGPPDEVLTFDLNEAALRDIDAARGGFFSIGGAILTLRGGPTFEEGLFASSEDGGVQRLVVETGPTPATKADCKRGGWRQLANDQGQPFRNQGACVRFVTTHRR